MLPSKVLLASSDLNARARIVAAAGDRTVVVTAPAAFRDRLDGVGILIVDLDQGGRAALDELELARGHGAVPGTVIAFFSHVDTELGRAARAAGCKAVTRGQLWAHLPELLGGS